MPASNSPGETTTYYDDGSLKVMAGPGGTVIFRMEGTSAPTGQSGAAEMSVPGSDALGFAAKILQVCGKQEMRLDGDDWVTS